MTKQPISRHASRKSQGARSIGGASICNTIFSSTILSIEDKEEREYVDWDEDGRHITKLNDQQWVLQRKKIGLSCHTEKIATKKRNSKTQKKEIVRFLKSFLRKECVKYVRDSQKQQPPKGACPAAKGDNTWPCYCGAPEYEHKPRQVIIILLDTTYVK